MQPDLILQEDGFCLEFRTRNNLLHPDSVAQMVGDDGYVLQERIIVPPHLAGQASSYSARTIAPPRCNNPLVFVGHPALAVQHASIIARPKTGHSRVKKSGRAIEVATDGIDILFSGPILGKQENDASSFIAAFNKISETMQGFSLPESAIARTWLFMDDISKDYEKANVARQQSFAKWNCAANNFLPASTGIQGHMIGKEALAVDFCAFSGDQVTIRQIPSPLQNEPTDYGKLFSRAVAVEFPRCKLLFVSGTASIDKTGSSVHIGNFRDQMSYTLEVISAIFGQISGDFSHIAQAIVYLKSSADMESCLRILDGTGFPRERALFQLGVDVCRDDLLCEIEATAVISNP